VLGFWVRVATAAERRRRQRRPARRSWGPKRPAAELMRLGGLGGGGGNTWADGPEAVRTVAQGQRYWEFLFAAR
jgi:hypothetical protein